LRNLFSLAEHFLFDCFGQAANPQNLHAGLILFSCKCTGNG
jgi:hypothetical protein